MKKPLILVVDDDPMFLDIYSTELRNSGYDVRIAEDGETALRIANDEHPDAILLDVLMPNLSGQEVLLRLKSDESTKAIPVIMLSIVDRDNEVDAAMRHGAVCYLVKSDMTPQQVIGELERCMK